MWELDHKDSWALKNWCFWTVVLEKTLESPMDSKEIQPVHPKGDQSWVFIGRTDVEAEIPMLWPPDVKSWLIGKNSDAGKDWRQEEKGTTEDEIVGWHHWLDGHELGCVPGVDGQRSLACCRSWGHKESDTTERLNWNYKIIKASKEQGNDFDIICAVLCLVAQLCLTLCDPMDCSPQAPLSMGVSRQEYWSGLPCPPLGGSSQCRNWTCIAGGFFAVWAPREAHDTH